MDAAAELGRNPVSKHQIQPEYGDEQADAGRDCRTRLARPNSQARTNADREIFIFPVQLTTCKTDNATRLIHTLVIWVTIHASAPTITRVSSVFPFVSLEMSLFPSIFVTLLCLVHRTFSPSGWCFSPL